MYRFLVVAFSILTLCGVSLSQELPDVPDAPTLRDDSVRLRSIDLERTSRDAKKANAAEKVTPHQDLNARYPAIEKDYLGIQRSRALIKDNLNDSNFKGLRKAAEKIEKQATGLHKNLFVDKVEKERPEKASKEEEKDLKSLVKELDNAIVAFIGSKMFANISVIKPEDATEGHKRLLRVMFLSKDLSKAAKIEEKAGK